MCWMHERRKVTFRFVFITRLYHRSTTCTRVIMEMRMGVRACIYICINFPVNFRFLHAPRAICTLNAKYVRSAIRAARTRAFGKLHTKYGVDVMKALARIRWPESDSDAEHLNEKCTWKMCSLEFDRHNWLFAFTLSRSLSRIQHTVALFLWLVRHLIEWWDSRKWMATGIER